MDDTLVTIWYVMLCPDTAVARNAERAALTFDHQVRQRMLSRELQDVNRLHRTEVSSVLFCGVSFTR